MKSDVPRICELVQHWQNPYNLDRSSKTTLWARRHATYAHIAMWYTKSLNEIAIRSPRLKLMIVRSTMYRYCTAMSIHLILHCTHTNVHPSHVASPQTSSIITLASCLASQPLIWRFNNKWGKAFGVDCSLCTPSPVFARSTGSCIDLASYGWQRRGW